MSAHIARRSETGEQICLHIEYGDQERAFAGLVWPTVVEYMGMRIDQAGQDRRMAEVDHSNSGRNFKLRLRSHVGDSVASKEHHLFGQHLAGLAIKQAAGAHGDDFRRRWALVIAATGRTQAGSWASPAPRLLLPRSLRNESGRHDQHARHK